MALRNSLIAAAVTMLLLGLSASLAHADSLTLLSTTPVTNDGRVTDYTFSTSALPMNTSVRVMLPAGYSSGGRYPVLYLLEGADAQYSSWYDKGGMNESFLDSDCGGPCQAIVVMPDGGTAGFYTNWFASPGGGLPNWQTYHMDQLIPWVDSHFNTIANRNGRAIAGESMGGFGTFSYAARYPDMFVSASAYSPVLDTSEPGMKQIVDGLNGPADVGAVFGDQTSEQIVWRGHNPTDLAPDYAGMSVTVRTGNGTLENPIDVMESYMHQQSLNFQKAMNNAGLPFSFTDYGPGTHSWPYWTNDIRVDLPHIMATFATPPPLPASTTYKTIEPSYAVHGWNVQITRLAREWSTLAGATSSGFQLTGSGTASVTTPPYYVAGGSCTVTTVSPTGKASTSTVTASATGTLTIPLTLGPANPYDEYSPAGGLVGGSRFFAVSALIATGTGTCKPSS